MPSFGENWVITITVTYWVQDAVFRLTKLWGGAQKGSVGKHQFYDLEKVNSITRPASKNVTEAMTRIKNGKKKKFQTGLASEKITYDIVFLARPGWIENIEGIFQGLYFFQILGTKIPLCQFQLANFFQRLSYCFAA